MPRQPASAAGSQTWGGHGIPVPGAPRTAGGISALSKKETRRELTLQLFRKKQIRMIALTLILFSVLTGVLFHVLEKKVWLDNLTASNETIADQVASIYELHLKNVQDLCMHSAAADNVLLQASPNRSGSAEENKSIVQYLTGLSVANEYIYSSYLYFPSDGLVFSSYSLPSTMTPIESFYDREAFSALPPTTAPLFLEPRPLDFQDVSGRGDIQVITMLISLPISAEPKTACLAVNIDAHRIYAQIVEDLQIKSHPAFYILGKDGSIIFNGEAGVPADDSALAEDGAQVISSRADSAWLGWSFVLESELPPVRSSLLTFCIVAIGILTVLLFAAVILTFLQTAPIRDILQTSRSLRWRYFLTSENSAADASFPQFNPGADFPGCHSFRAMSFRLQKAAGEGVEGKAADANGNGSAAKPDAEGAADFPGALKEILTKLSRKQDFRCQIFSLTPDRAGAVLGFASGASPDAEKLPASIAREALTLLESRFRCAPVCCLSSAVNSVRQLPAAWQEVSEIEKYSWSLGTPLRTGADIAQGQEAYEFPLQTEKQLVNTLLAGNIRDCLAHSRAIFASFTDGPWILDNTEIRKYLYFIQNDILSRLASMPIPVRVESDFLPKNCDSLKELEDSFERYLLSVLSAISSRDIREKESLDAAVIDFIDGHYRENVICLNMVSEHFGLTNGQVSRIVREMTGKNFSVYVTEKRIEKSRELLRENKMTVNEISDYLGFSYPYYFIRKFRELEGVTPGQYSGQAADSQFAGGTDS